MRYSATLMALLTMPSIILPQQAQVEACVGVFELDPGIAQYEIMYGDQKLDEHWMIIPKKLSPKAQAVFNQPEMESWRPKQGQEIIYISFSGDSVPMLQQLKDTFAPFVAGRKRHDVDSPFATEFRESNNKVEDLREQDRNVRQAKEDDAWYAASRQRLCRPPEDVARVADDNAHGRSQEVNDKVGAENHQLENLVKLDLETIKIVLTRDEQTELNALMNQKRYGPYSPSYEFFIELLEDCIQEEFENTFSNAVWLNDLIRQLSAKLFLTVWKFERKLSLLAKAQSSQMQPEKLVAGAMDDVHQALGLIISQTTMPQETKKQMNQVVTQVCQKWLHEHYFNPLHVKELHTTNKKKAWKILAGLTVGLSTMLAVKYRRKLHDCAVHGVQSSVKYFKKVVAERDWRAASYNAVSTLVLLLVNYRSNYNV